MRKLSRLSIGSAILLGGLYFTVAASAPTETPKDWHFRQAGQIPVLHRGRPKPFDTLARTSLTILSHKDTCSDGRKLALKSMLPTIAVVEYRDRHLEDRGPKISAVEWLLDVMTADQHLEPARSENVRAFRVDSEQIRSFLDLAPTDDSLYAFADFSGKTENLLVEADRARKLPANAQTELDKNVLDLALQIAMYAQFSRYETPHRVFRIENDQVLNLLGLERRERLRYGYDEFVPRIAALTREADRASNVPQREQSVYDVKVLELAHHVKLYADLAGREGDPRKGDALKMVPPTKLVGEWKLLHEALKEIQAGEHNPLALGLVGVLRDYATGGREAFNKDVDSYLKLFNDQLPALATQTGFEVFFNRFDPFYHCSLVYVLVFLLALVSLFPGLRSVGWSAFALGAIVLAVHSWAILARMTIQGRPPVTNLYSSAVFIGWGCVLLCLVMAVMLRGAYQFPPGLACGIGAALGFPSLLIAHYLSLGGDTLEMMQAVLDTNFWLATHVTCVTFGYVATLVAGAFGLVLLLTCALEPVVGKPVVKLVGTMTYSVVCFATLLSFTGTVLGGLWADVSWGRFWGWDPKENGALLIVIWNALVLHARWGGMVKERGLALLTLVGNMVTAWSWFGTNQLGVGLHAYGFNNSLAFGCSSFWVGNIALSLGGLAPMRLWHNFLQNRTPPSPELLAKAPGKKTSRAPGDGRIGLNPTS